MELVEVLKTALAEKNIEMSEIASHCFIRIEDITKNDVNHGLL